MMNGCGTPAALQVNFTSATPSFVVIDRGDSVNLGFSGSSVTRERLHLRICGHNYIR